MEELNTTNTINETTEVVEEPVGPAPKVERISLAELRAETSKITAEENKFYEAQREEQRRREEEKKQKQKEKDEAFAKEIDDFFESLLSASQEDRDEFFRLINEDIANAGKK